MRTLSDVGETVRPRKAIDIGAETPTGLVRRARRIDRVLAETYPDARAELDFDDAFQCLVVTVLSRRPPTRGSMRCARPSSPPIPTPPRWRLPTGLTSSRSSDRSASSAPRPSRC